MFPKFIDGVAKRKVNLELEKGNQTHPALGSGKLVLRKFFFGNQLSILGEVSGKMNKIFLSDEGRFAKRTIV